MLIYMCVPGVIRKTVSGNLKRIFRLYQIGPKEFKLKFELFFYDNF